MKADQAQQLLEAINRIVDIPKESFRAVQPPQAPEPPAIDAQAIRRAHASLARKRTSIFARRERKTALAEAERLARAEIARLNEEYPAQRARWQAELSKGWAAYCANDPDLVLPALARAFEDNEAAAAAVGLKDDEVTLVVIVPPADVLPERKPSTTAAGNLSLKKLTKRETAELYNLLVTGYMLVTVKECFAVAPGVNTARVVAIRPSPRDSYGKQRPEALAAATLERTRMNGIRWDATDAALILNATNSELLINQKGVVKALHPLDLNGQPELTALLESIDFEELTDAN